MIKTEIVINASKEKVWSILTDFESYSSWNPFLVSIEGKPVIGSRLKNTMLNNGRRYVFRPTVLSVEPYRYFDWLGSFVVRGLFDGHHYFEIDELTSDRFKFTQGEHFSGILSKAIMKRIGDDTRENFVKMNEAIKRRAERDN